MDLADMPLQRSGWDGSTHLLLLLLRVGSPVLESCQKVDGLHRPQTASAARRWLRHRQCWLIGEGEKRRVFLAIIAVARMVIWMTRKKGLYDGANFSDRYLILFFRHQLRVKIRFDRKKFEPHTIRQKMGECREPGRTKECDVGIILPFSSCTWQRWSGSLSIQPLVSRIFLPQLVECYASFSPSFSS